MKELPIKTAGINFALSEGMVGDIFGMLMVNELAERCPGALEIPITISENDLNMYRDWVNSLTSAVEDIDFNRFINAVEQSKQVAKTLDTEVADPIIELPLEFATGYMSFSNRAAKLSGDVRDSFIEEDKEVSKKAIEAFIDSIEGAFENYSYIEKEQHEIIEAISNSVDRTVKHVSAFPQKIKMVKPYGEPDLRDSYSAVKSSLKVAKRSLKNL